MLRTSQLPSASRWCPTIVLVSILTFAIVQLFPGSVGETILGAQASPEAVAEIEASMGLDKPLPEQYVSWAGGAVQGDFGESIAIERGQEVAVDDRRPSANHAVTRPAGTAVRRLRRDPGRGIRRVPVEQPLDRAVTIRRLDRACDPELLARDPPRALVGSPNSDGSPPSATRRSATESGHGSAPWHSRRSRWGFRRRR